jgi:hypothetical protein
MHGPSPSCNERVIFIFTSHCRHVALALSTTLYLPQNVKFPGIVGTKRLVKGDNSWGQQVT